MHKQRIWVASIAGFGLLTPFLPWVNFMGLIGVSGTEVAQGWVAAVIFGAAIAVALTGSRAYALDGTRRGVLSILGASAIGFGVWKYIEISNGTVELGGEIGREMKKHGGEAAGELGREVGRGFSKMFGDNMFELGFGVYAVIIAGAALIIAALLKRRAT